MYHQRSRLVVGLFMIAVACDSTTEVQVVEFERLGQVAAVKLGPVVDREINLAITTEGDGCLKSTGRTEVSTEGMTIDITPFDTISVFGGVCTSIRRAFTREVGIVVPNAGNYTATIHGRDAIGDTTTTIREITVR